MSAGPPKLDRPTALVLAVAVIICVGTSLYMMPYVPDDSYISFRYAENLARGHGLAYNPGDPPVEGYSNFLWILLCALLHKVGFELPTFMPYVGVLLLALSVTTLWAIFRRRAMPPLQMLFPLLLLASSGPLVVYTISGLEAPLFALLLMVMVYWMDRAFDTGATRWFILLAVGGLLLSLTRPEGVAAVPAIVVLMFYLTRKDTDGAFARNRMRGLAIAAGAFVVLFAIYNAWRIGYFGEVLPTPFISKGGGGKSLWYAWWANIKIYFYKQGDYYPPVGYYFVALILLGFIGHRMSAARRALRRTEFAAVLMGVIYSAIYFNFKDWMPAMRYHSVLTGLFLIPGAHVLTPLFKNVDEWSRETRTRFWVVGAAAIFMSYTVVAELKIVTERAEISNQECLVKLGRWLREIMPPDATLAMSDVGAVPYYSGFRTIDIHPESLTDLHIAKNGFDKDYIFEVNPDVVILPSRSIFLTKFYPEHFDFGDDPRFRRRYRFLGVSRFDWYQDRCYWIFIPGPYPKIPRNVMERFPHGIGTISNVKN